VSLNFSSSHTRKDDKNRDNPQNSHTETDKAIEALISRRVKEQFPDHGFIGEETVSDDGKSLALSSYLFFLE
jgi:fructose-1,6-bisphosphatase/inositol monophosphatase family enzyme